MQSWSRSGPSVGVVELLFLSCLTDRWCLEVDRDRIARGKAVCKRLIEQFLEMVTTRPNGHRPFSFAIRDHR